MGDDYYYLYQSIDENTCKITGVTGYVGPFPNSLNIPAVNPDDGRTVVQIKDDAFYDCINLVNLTFASQSSLTSIGANAFYGCNNLLSLTFASQSSLTTIGINAFYNCNSLTSLTFASQSSLTTIGINAFYNCNSLTSLTFASQNSLISIGSNAFYGCNNLLSLNFASESYLTTIGAGAFSNCNNLLSLTFASQSSLTTIGAAAFYGCNNLLSLTFPSENSLISIGAYAFFDCNNLPSFILPSSLTSIGDSAFQGCNNLLSLDLPNSLTSIGASAFFGYINDEDTPVVLPPKTNLSLFISSFSAGTYTTISFIKGDELNINTNGGYISTGTLPAGLSIEGGLISGTIASDAVTSTISLSGSGPLFLTFEISDPVHTCLLACSSVLLSDYTYKPISQVTTDDSVLCPFSKQPKKIKRCRCNIVDLKNLHVNNFPYRIPKAFFTPTIPEKDVFISGYHRIITPSITNIFDWIQTHRIVPDEHKITNEEDILKITGESEVKYYHIELEGGKGGMFIDGLPVETLGENE